MFKNNNCNVEFIINLTDTPKLNILIIYNKDKNILDNYEENKYIVYSPDTNRKEYDYKTLKNEFKNQNFDFTSPNRNILNLKETSDLNEQRNIIRRN